jgi:hypothetical protein
MSEASEQHLLKRHSRAGRAADLTAALESRDVMFPALPPRAR